MNRRHFLRAVSRSAIGAGAALSASLIWANNRAGAAISTSIDDLRQSWRDFLPAGYSAVSADETLTLSKSEWQERLGEPMAFSVLRNEATERPFTSELNKEKREGTFLCAGCDLPVFTSAMKFESGTGWPSFFTTIPGAFEKKRDFKLILPRTEYHCARCGGHHGHVFNDGPPPTGERWCNNGAALRFLPKA